MRVALLAAAVAAAMCVPLAQGVAGDRPKPVRDVAPRVAFELPYDLVVARNGSIVFPDRARILALAPSTGRVRVLRRVPGATEIVGLERLENGTLFATDLPSGKILRIPRTGPVETVASVEAPVDLVADPSGSTLWVASIAEGVGLVRVDVASGRVEPFAAVAQPHGLARMADGSFVAHDGQSVSRVDATGAVTPFASIDAFELVVAPNGVVYGLTGTPRGGRVVRIPANGRAVPVAGTGRLGPHRDGKALRAPMLPSALALAPNGALFVAQIEPVPAIRRLKLSAGTIVTLARGR
jgi:streptogramin lyase